MSKSNDGFARNAFERFATKLWMVLEMYRYKNCFCYIVFFVHLGSKCLTTGVSKKHARRQKRLKGLREKNKGLRM